MKRSIGILAILGAVLAFGAPANPQSDNVGAITFPTSATGETQQHFLRGVAILHSFGWEQAIEQFQAAQALDPDFAMAYWGETLCYNHPLGGRLNPESPRKALARLGSTKAERLAKAPTDREKGFLNAVEILWGDGDEVARRVGYMEAMGRLHEQYPDDPEVAAFYALSMLSATRATGDRSLQLEVRAGTLTLKLLFANPNHPGAAHYTIHAFDDALHAPLALDAALRFAEIAPAVAHARHMPTHIFIQHGMWDYVSNHNQSAYDAARDPRNPVGTMGDALHALDWGQYGDLQRGDYAKARTWIDRLQMIAEESGNEFGTSVGRIRVRAVGSLVRARYIVETEEWKVEPITDESTADELLTTGLSAARTGDQATVQQAEAALAKLVEKDGGGGGAQIMHKQVGALLHAGMGHGDVATGLMDEALNIVDTMRPPGGPASPIKPPHELYGEILLDLDRPADAIEKFETSLSRMPNRPRSLLGLARAYAQTGNREKAAAQYATLVKVWEGLESFEGLQEAKRFLETTDGR